ncbi:tol-pal system protein YbgF [Proteobacteria bacterium 005FR1]|nr:tol-pal system protein YbgF [Proteobacteria bacterium 005FR1]
MKCPLITAAGLAAVLFLPLTASAEQLQLAQVEVIESSPIRAIGQPRATANNDRNPNAATAGNGSSDMMGELFYQLQILQQEVQTLRGQVEEQAYQLQQLKQQRMDDYVDLDRRISELSRSGSAATSAAPASGSANANGNIGTTAQAPAAPAGNAADSEFASYSAAVDLATKQQAFDQAITALNQHLRQYPDGRYAANAHYWLGQIYFVQGKMEEARQAFTRVVEGYPDHNKAPEARYKLGQVYFRLGDQARARTLLEKVANSNSDVAPLARNFLQQNFR